MEQPNQSKIGPEPWRKKPRKMYNVSFSSGDDDPNAVLFIMETRCPRKYCLKLTAEAGSYLDLHTLKEELWQLLDGQLPGGTIMKVANVEGVSVLVWNFEMFSSCSNISAADFCHVKTSQRELDLPMTGLVGNVGWSFFTLDENINDDVFTCVNKDGVKTSYVFPTPSSEKERMNALLNSISSVYGSNCITGLVDAAKTTYHYCEFSGGGDLFMTARQSPQSASLVFLVSDQEEDKDGDDNSTLESSPPPGDSQSRPSTNISPPTPGTSKLTSLSIEVKKDSVVDLEKLKHQLWANMVVSTVRRYFNAFPRLTKSDVFQVKKLVGYGIACTGSGIVGVYKVEMEFNEETRFITKVEIGTRARLAAAIIIDCGIKYYVDNKL